MNKKIWTLILGLSFVLLACDQSSVRFAECASGPATTLTFSDLTASTMLRDSSTMQISLSDEKVNSTYVPGYREVPDVLKDNDAADGSSLVVLAVRPTVTCGISQGTLTARVADCLLQNGANATWAGAAKGISGEGTWNLVTRTSTAYGVWKDARTGLLWSDDVTLGAGDSWCKAAGNHQATDPYGLCSDPAGSCANGAYTNEAACISGNSIWTPTHQAQIQPQSYCAELDNSGAQLFAFSGGTENYTLGTYSDAKGNMGRVNAGGRPSVRWRLPTRWDYYQAERDGLRYVLPRASSIFLTATVTNPNLFAFYFNAAGTGGGIGFASRDDSSPKVRCVGR